MPRRYYMALVTGGTKGIGYQISKELLRGLSRFYVLMTTRNTNTDGMDTVLGMELGGGARQRSKFLTMDVADPLSVNQHEGIVKRFDGLNFLIHNAGIYEKPDLENFNEQAQRIIQTNYWGTKNVYTTFGSYLKDEARIINITSNLAHVNEENMSEEMNLKMITRDRFASCRNLYELDGRVLQFQDDVSWGLCKERGWPECAFTVSKLAVNAFTRFVVSFRYSLFY